MENNDFNSDLTTGQGEINNNSAAPQAENGTEDAFTVRFNHEDRVLTRDEAVSFAQKGLKYDSVQPLLNELKLLASIRNTSPEDAVREYLKIEEDAFKLKLNDEYGDDENAKNALFEKFKNEMRSKSEALNIDNGEKEKKAFTEKIAEEFSELIGECPEIDSLEKIPVSVIRAAKKENLLNAYLRYKNREDRKILKAKESQAKNKNASAGDLNGGGEQVDTLLSAFIKGLKF